MRNVGVAVAASAWLLASTRESTAMAVADVVARAGENRLGVEQREGAKLAAAASDQPAANTRQDQIIVAWKKWYGEAVLSAARLVTGTPSPALVHRLDELAAPFIATK
jgi:hypothetical protein